MAEDGSSMVTCPVCDKPVLQFMINSHIDSGCQIGVSGPGPASQSRTTPKVRPKSTPKRKRHSESPSKKDPPFSPEDGESSANNKDSGDEPRVVLAPSQPSSSKDKKGKRPALAPASLTQEAPPTKRFKSNAAVQAAKPLADFVRPTNLDDFIGQEEILGEGTLLRSLIQEDKAPSMVLWGGPGTGKTTLARIISHTTKAAFRQISATESGIADIRKIFEEAKNMLRLTGRRTYLFVDEIQRFNKGQQDIFLPYIEDGSISAIFATTENPSFRLQGALLSRCKVFVFKKHTLEDCERILRRALNLLDSSSEDSDGFESGILSPSSSRHPVSSGSSSLDEANASSSFQQSRNPIDDDVIKYLAFACDGDARMALSSLESALSVKAQASKPLDRTSLLKALGRTHLAYDRTGDAHYDTISALHKSVRGGDADAALYWLARMLESGDDPLYVARRCVRMASEDIGLANPNALPQAIAAYQSAQLIGMPECDCILAQTVVMLAESPKSTRTYNAYSRAKALVGQHPAYPVPHHIRNAPTRLMKDLGYGKEYKYEPAYAHPVNQTFFPPELLNTHLLRDEGSLEGKEIDLNELTEWEKVHNHGQRWEGRDRVQNHLEEQEDKFWIQTSSSRKS